MFELGKKNQLGQWGLIASIAYLVTLCVVALLFWPEFKEMAPNAWGDFLAGTLGPLALFWLVLGFFQQGQELKNSVEALKLQTEELRNSVEQQSSLSESTHAMLRLESDKIVTEARRIGYFTYSDITRQASTVPQLIEELTDGGRAAFAARGQLQSGAVTQWVETLEGISERIRKIAQETVDIGNLLRKETDAETLLDKSAELHDLRNRLTIEQATLEGFKEKLKIMQQEPN